MRFLCVFAPCMFKKTSGRSTASRRVRMTRSVATSHADTTGGPKPVAPCLFKAVAKRGSSRSRVVKPEQPNEPLPLKKASSHPQERVAMTLANPTPTDPTVAGPAYVGIDVSKAKLDLAIDGQEQVQTFSNDDPGIMPLVEQLCRLRPTLIVVEATGGYERAVLRAALEANLPIARVQPG